MIPDFSQIGWVPPRRAPIEVKGQRMTPEGLVSIDAVNLHDAGSGQANLGRVVR
ncbi:hypothetical protein [Mesorhizobium huakuii]|uniref:Uncharacterized protein n=1 Tax=Mesorhizobium huakuii TaxID=28104 RepID=A0A7G6T5B7_9HYPH|nr:hypothetical protein [Mesorhizobium huakuii]QND61949.1 hypothetical protein HB778_39860 [Mesorhizobium huakuii]QND69335.1 hypothetical protein HB777_39810 [Mesorhizobium loti]